MKASQPREFVDNLPHHASERLPHDVAKVIADRPAREPRVELISIRAPVIDAIVKRLLVRHGDVVLRSSRCEFESNDDASALGRDVEERVVGSGLGALLIRVDELTTTRRVRRLRSSRGRRWRGLITVLVRRRSSAILGISVGVAGRERGRLVGRMVCVELREVAGGLGLLGSVRRDDVIVEGILNVGALVLSSVEALKRGPRSVF